MSAIDKLCKDKFQNHCNFCQSGWHHDHLFYKIHITKHEASFFILLPLFHGPILCLLKKFITQPVHCDHSNVLWLESKDQGSKCSVWEATFIETVKWQQTLTNTRHMLTSTHLSYKNGSKHYHNASCPSHRHTENPPTLFTLRQLWMLWWPVFDCRSVIPEPWDWPTSKSLPKGWMRNTLSINTWVGRCSSSRTFS